MSLRYGIKFRYTPPPINSIYATDSFCWVQVAIYSFAFSNSDSILISKINALDTSFPYSNSIETDDGPGIQLTNNATYAKQTLVASMYLMYKPDAEGATWVPLKKVNWSCNGIATKNNNNG